MKMAGGGGEKTLWRSVDDDISMRGPGKIIMTEGSIDKQTGKGKIT